MPQKFFDQLRNLPYHIQNLGFVQKLNVLLHNRGNETFGSLSSVYGCPKSPSAMSFDDRLGLIALGTELGSIVVYGAPGIAFHVRSSGSAVIYLQFLPEEGRLISAHSDGKLCMFELNSKTGIWSDIDTIHVATGDDKISALGLGHGILYVGCQSGTLHQVALKDGRICLGDSALTSLTSSMVMDSIPADKRDQIRVDSPIVSIESQPGGCQLLLAYASGCVIVSVPQTMPETNGSLEPNEAAAENVVADPAKPGETESDLKIKQPPADAATEQPPVDATAEEPEPTPSVASTPQRTKSQTEKKATLLFKELSKSLRRPESLKAERDTAVAHCLPPPPRVSHVLLRDQKVEWATWKLATVDTMACDITVAYEDGAFQNWPISSVVNGTTCEPIFVTERDPSTSPYGPLPCGAMKKVLQNPAKSGCGVLTAFSGGLPRAQFDDRHTVSLLHNHEILVCFQFASKVIDFVFVPNKPDPKEGCEDAQSSTPVTSPCAPQHGAALLVLTELELVAIDLDQPSLPAFASPYLDCLDAVPVTSIAHVTKVPDVLMSRLKLAIPNTAISSSNWPIWGGSTCDQVKLDENPASDLVLLGHVNGWVSLIAIGKGDSTHRLGSFHTDVLFNMADSTQRSSRQPIEVETWPPFRLVGECALKLPFYNTGSVDPRLAVCHLSASLTNSVDDASQSLTVVVGGSAGQVSVWQCSLDEQLKKTFEPDVSRIMASLYESEITENPMFAWKGPSALMPFEGVMESNSALMPRYLIQLNPPSPVSAVAIDFSWNLLVVGCSHGFAVVDLLSKSTIYTDFVFGNSSEIRAETAAKWFEQVSSVQTSIINRSKQIGATMRQSFRRLKHSRKSAAKSPTTDNDETDKQSEPLTDAVPQAEVTTSCAEASETIADAPATGTESNAATTSQVPEPAPSAPADESSTVPSSSKQTESVEQPREPIPLHPFDMSSSTVGTVMFADTFVVSPVASATDQPTISSVRTPSLWIGTPFGKVTAYSLDWDETNGPVTVKLCKELQLHRKAPVIGLCIIDSVTQTPVLTSSRSRHGCELVPKPAEVVQPEPIAEATVKESDGEEKMLQSQTEAEASQPPVQATPSLPTESHLLLLCSEEQVKLFQLPTLRALYKHRFVDTSPFHLTGTGVTTTTSASSGTEQMPVAETKEEVASPVNGEHVEPTEEPTEQPKPTESTVVSTAPSTPHPKMLTGFGVHAFPRGSVNEQLKTEWNVVVTRYDGKIVVLSLPHLRPTHKVPTVVDQLEHPSLCRVTSLSEANLVFWLSHGQLLTVNMAQNSGLFSPAQSTFGTPPSVFISLPVWARPIDTSKTATAQLPSDNVETAVPADVSAAPENGDSQTNGTEAGEAEKVVDSSEEKSKEPVVAASAGDITMDSIKEYMNGEGTVTIRTVETSSEKRTLVEGGNVMTTVRETESVDGKLVKDELHKFSTQEDSTTPHLVTETTN